MSSIGAGLVIPDLWQQEAVRALQQGKDAVVQAPTGSGKTSAFPISVPGLPPKNVPRPAVKLAPCQRYLRAALPEPENSGGVYRPDPRTR